MPIYDLQCAACGVVEEVIVLSGEFEPDTCQACGGALRRIPSRFGVSGRYGQTAPTTRSVAKPCGHGSACRCAVKLHRPNPFADRLVPVSPTG